MKTIYQINRDGTVSFSNDPVLHVHATPQTHGPTLTLVLEGNLPFGMRIVRYMDRNPRPEGFTGRQIAEKVGLDAKQVLDRLCELGETGWVKHGVAKGVWHRTEQTSGPFGISGALDLDVWVHLEYLFEDRGTQTFTATDLGVLMGGNNGGRLGSSLRSLKNLGVIVKVNGGWSIVPEKLWPDAGFSAEAA